MGICRRLPRSENSSKNHPEKRIRELAAEVKAFVVPEINLGQMVLEVERCAAGKVPAIHVPHAGGGVHDPEKICKAIVEAAR